MRRSLLATLFSTFALSLGSVFAANGEGSNSRAHSRPLSIYDAMGTASNSIVCGKNVYSKLEAYAAVAEAMMLKKKGNYVVTGCESLKVCSKYPRELEDQTLAFKVPKPYHIFPILHNREIYKGGFLPVRDLVVMDSFGEVVGIVTAKMGRYVKCLVDDNYKPRSRNVVQRFREKINYWRGSK